MFGSGPWNRTKLLFVNSEALIPYVPDRIVYSFHPLGFLHLLNFRVEFFSNYLYKQLLLKTAEEPKSSGLNDFDFKIVIIIVIRLYHIKFVLVDYFVIMGSIV